MSIIGQWSTTAAANGTLGSPPDYWPEGQAPSTVNNCAREMMAQIRSQWNHAAWFDWGYTVTRVSGTSFTVVTATGGWNTVTLPAAFIAGGRIKLFDTSTLYGTIDTVSVSAASTTVTFTPDSGSLTNSFTSVANSIIEPSNSPIPGGGSTGSSSPEENVLFNSSFQVAQLGTSFTSATTPANNDDTYLLDQWILLSDGNDVVDVTQETSVVPTGIGTAIKLEVETANAKFGIFQPLENKDAVNLAGRAVSVSFKARNAAADDLTDVLKCVVLAWDSTADAITSDVVSAWNADLTTPTFAANWTAENTPANLTLTQDYQRFEINDITIDTASTANIGLFIWCDNADGAIDDAIYITEVKLEIGRVSGSYYPESFANDLQKCERYLEKSFNYTTVPAQNIGTNTGEVRHSQNVAAASAQNGCFGFSFTVRKRITPTVTGYNPGAANAQARNINTAADYSTTVFVLGETHININTVTDAGSAGGQAAGIHYVADARL